jgi:hypothetical protein
MYFLAFDNYIPVVMLLLGGDFTTLAAICKGLEDGTSVVVVRVRIFTSSTIPIQMKNSTRKKGISSKKTN